MSAPRVLCVCDFLLRYTASLTAALSREGADATLLTRTHDLDFDGSAEARAAYLGGVLPPAVRLLELAGRPRQPRAWRGAIGTARALRDPAPDVVHVQQRAINDPRLLLAAAPRPGRYAYTVHDVVPHPGDTIGTGYHRWLEVRLARAAGLVFVHAETLVEPVRELLGVRAPIAVVPLGSDEPTPSPPPGSSREILFFGRLSWYKGLDVLLDAMPAVWEQLDGVTLRVAGEGVLPDHPVLHDPRVDVRAEHVPDAELPELFRRAGVVVLPYREASQSAVGALAKGFGRPLVATRTGGLPELLGDGSGLLVDPEDPGGLADAIVQVLASPALARRLVAAGTAGVLARSSWARVAQSTLAAYERHGLLSHGSGA